MIFLPTENITYRTKLNEEEIVKKLGDVLEPEKSIGFDGLSSGSSPSYYGQIKGRTFYIYRIITYRNTFLPRINGYIESDSDGTTINVKMRLHFFVILFMFFWFSGVGFGFILALKEIIRSSEFNPGIVVTIGMLLFGYFGTLLAFKSESYRSKKDLKTIFEADVIKE